MAPLLVLEHATKSFGAVQALFEVDFHVAPGEVMALVGDNGAGKSTLIKCIAGIHPVDSGEVVFEGNQVSIHGPKAASDLGIEVVYQDLALAKGETPTVSDSVNNGKKDVPSQFEDPVAVTKDNIKDYLGEPDFPKKEEICAGKLAEKCTELGL